MSTTTQISKNRLALRQLNSRLAPVLDPDLRKALQYATDLVAHVHACVDKSTDLRDSSLAGHEYIELLQSIVPGELPAPLAVLTIKTAGA